MVESEWIFLLVRGMLMKTKTLRTAGLSENGLGCLVNFLAILLALYVAEWVCELEDIKITATRAAIALGLGLAITDCFFSKLSFVGWGVAVSTSLGQTAALSVFFWPLPPQQILLIWFTLSVLSYNFGLARIERLKKQGFVEKLEDEASQG